jgi:Protein of unknown function (DUF732)
MSKTRICMLAATVMSTSLVVAVPAHADNSSDFLAMVSGEGLNVGDTPADVELTLAKGDQICHLIHIGYTPETAGRQVKYEFPNATARQVAGFVEAAQAKLCVQSFETPLQPAG